MSSLIFSLVDLHRSGLEWFLSTLIVLLALSSIWVLVGQSEKLRGAHFAKIVNNIGIFGSIGLLIFTSYLIIAAKMQNPYSMEVEIATSTITLALVNLLTLGSWRTQLVSRIRTLLVFLGDMFIFLLASFQMVYEFPHGIQSLILFIAAVLTAVIMVSILRHHLRLKKMFVVILVLFSVCLVLLGLWQKIIPWNCPCNVDVAICTADYQAFDEMGRNFVKLIMLQRVDNYKVSGCYYLPPQSPPAFHDPTI